MKSLIALIHRTCEEPAIWATERPRLAERPDLSKLRLADGSRPIAGTKPYCSSCGAHFGPGDVTPEGGWG